MGIGSHLSYVWFALAALVWELLYFAGGRKLGMWFERQSLKFWCMLLSQSGSPIANLKIVVKKCFMTRICFSLLLALLSEYFGAILDGPSKLVFKP